MRDYRHLELEHCLRTPQKTHFFLWIRPCWWEPYITFILSVNSLTETTLLHQTTVYLSLSMATITSAPEHSIRVLSRDQRALLGLQKEGLSWSWPRSPEPSLCFLRSMAQGPLAPFSALHLGLLPFSFPWNLRPGESSHSHLASSRSLPF